MVVIIQLGSKFLATACIDQFIAEFQREPTWGSCTYMPKVMNRVHVWCGNRPNTTITSSKQSSVMWVYLTWFCYMYGPRNGSCVIVPNLAIPSDHCRIFLQIISYVLHLMPFYDKFQALKMEQSLKLKSNGVLSISIGLLCWLVQPRRVTHKIYDPKFIYGRPNERGALGVKEGMCFLT